MYSIQEDCLEGKLQEMEVASEKPRGGVQLLSLGNLSMGNFWRIHKNALEEREIAFQFYTLKGHWCQIVSHQSNKTFLPSSFPSYQASTQERPNTCSKSG